MRYALACALVLCFAVTWAGADTIEDNLSAYTDETAAGYLAPLSDGFGQNLNTGYFMSAYIPKDSFYIRFNLHFMNVKFSDDDRTFTASPDPDFPSDETVTAPTVVGDTEAVELMADGAVFVFPGGLDISGMALAVPELVIGSVSGTEGIIRWFGYDTNTEEIEKIELLGLGVRHSVSQYFEEDFPVDLAASLMYQTFKVGDDLIDGSALAFGAQASREYSVLTPFVAVTLDRWENTTKYTANEGTEDEEEREVDFDSQTDLHLTLGTSAKLSFVRLFGAINVAGRFGWNVGLSFGN